MLPTVVLMLTYLCLMAILAFTVDLRFLVNDGLAVVVFAIFLLIALLADRPRLPSPATGR